MIRFSMTVFSLLVSQVIDECCMYRQMVMTDFPIQYHYLWVKEQLFYFHSLAIFHFLFETPFCRIIHHFQVKFYYYLHLFIDRIVISYPINRIRFYKYIYICAHYIKFYYSIYIISVILSTFFILWYFLLHKKIFPS